MKKFFVTIGIMLIACSTVLAGQVGITTSPLKDSPINVFNESNSDLLFILPVGIRVEIIDLNPIKNVPYYNFIKVKILEGEFVGKIGLVGKDLVVVKR